MSSLVMRALQEWSKCVMLLIRLICGTHSTFPYSPVSLPSGRGEAGSYAQPALEQGKAKHRSCLVSIAFPGEFPRYEQIYLAGLMDLRFAEGSSARRARSGLRVEGRNWTLPCGSTKKGTGSHLQLADGQAACPTVQHPIMLAVMTSLC